MSLSKTVFFRGLLFVALGAAPWMANVGTADTILTIDGRDVANLASDGNHGTAHNPPVNFAFVYGGVTADNPDAGPGDPPTATETDFNLLANNSGGLGFGVAAAGDMVFDATQYQIEIDLTVNPANTMTLMRLDLKDADPPLGAVEEPRYDLVVPAPGTTTTLVAALSTPNSIFSPVNSIVDFTAINRGLREIQIQYPFGAPYQDSGAILDITIHEIRISSIVPEPTTIVLAGMCGIAMCGFSLRRRSTAV
jgi:hypothetical protein